MFKKYKKLILFFSIVVLVLTPLVFVSAEGLVPCGGPGDKYKTCELCHLYLLTQEIIDFLMWNIAPALGILVIAWGGFNILIAGGEPAKKQAGYKAITTAIVGLLIVFGAWIIINEFLLFFVGQETGTANIFSNPWTDVQCRIK